MRGTELLTRLIPTAAKSLERILTNQRGTLWGNTELKLRVRKYPKSGEERVSIVKPHLSQVKLFSHILKKHVAVKITPEMLRNVESKGGLDEYLLHTPDRLLNSDVASTLRWEIMQTQQQQMQQRAGRGGQLAPSQNGKSRASSRSSSR